jgi:hypothetical protein
MLTYCGHEPVQNSIVLKRQQKALKFSHLRPKASDYISGLLLFSLLSTKSG